MKKINNTKDREVNITYTASFDFKQAGRFYAIIHEGHLYLTRYEDVATHFKGCPTAVKDNIHYVLLKTAGDFPGHRYKDCYEWKWNLNQHIK